MIITENRHINKRLSQGFTLAELLVVVAIIAVLVAIAIPVFSAQTEKAREATDIANIRGAYAEVATEAIGDNDTTLVKTVELCQKKDGWDVSSNKTTLEALGDVSGEPTEDGTCEVSWQSDAGKVLFTFSGSSSGGGSVFPTVLSTDKQNEKMRKFVDIVETVTLDNLLTPSSDWKIEKKIDGELAFYMVSIRDGTEMKPVAKAMEDAGLSESWNILTGSNTAAYVFYDANKELIGYGYQDIVTEPYYKTFYTLCDANDNEIYKSTKSGYIPDDSEFYGIFKGENLL